ncbi:heme exporter protein CcmB [Marinomonas sp. A79]|uniref:Heme exporter protein B n=1 Tax=Marinomonas vulgaris TaxID=2823372 RepID=A0ABS5HAJ8_9GAMM|nr:heme exporter protein CcmB [Marinomonas vulgaris]MBR7888665.1 heme exporter protein CcmB [Marinomonas vulgaris]
MTYTSFMRAQYAVLWRSKQDVLNALLFFVIVVTLFPLGIDPSPAFLTPAAGGIVWCATVLALLMAIEGVFKEDYRDGSMEQWVVSGLSLSLLVLIKVMLQWGAVVLPLLVMTPLLGQMLFLPNDDLGVLMLTLLLGTPSIFLMGALGAALTVSLKQGAMLVMLLILPFYVPVIIFATSGLQAAQAGLPYSGFLAMLLAMSLLSLVVSPFLSAIAIKASVN